MPERPEPERVVIVLRADESGTGGLGGSRTVDVGMHQMGVDDVGAAAAYQTNGTEEQCRVEVMWGAEAVVWDVEPVELRVEGIWLAIVEAQEASVHAAFPQSRQQRQQMALGAPDAAQPVDVSDPHRGSPFLTRRLASVVRARVRTIAAGMPNRKSHGTR